MESLVEKDEVSGSYATNWGTMNFGIGGQYLISSKGKISYGAEIMYQYLYWYSVRIPYGGQTIYREYSVSAVRITPILRYGVNSNFAIDVGPEFNIMDGLNLGVFMSFNYYIPISDKFDIMDNLVLTVPISLNAGIRIKL